MNTTATDPRMGIGGNKPPMAEQVKANHADLFKRFEELMGALELVPPVIENDEQEGQAQDTLVAIKKAVKTGDAMHKLEKEPYDTIIKEIKATFAKPIEALDKIAKTINERLDVYKEKKAAAERRKREEEARKAREEQEARERAAAEAERKRREAQEARELEERRAREAQAAREKAEREAREANERAEKAREEARALEEARKRQKEQDERDAEQRKKDEAAAAARRAELKAQQEAAEKEAREAREKAAAALAERRAAEEAAQAAKKDEKAANREVNNNLDDAVKLEKRANRLDDAAQASEAELSRGRGDYGSVGSRVTVWKWRMLNRDRVPLEALRAYLNADAIDAAVTRYMNAHRAELGTGRDRDDLLKGVEFYQEQSTRVA